MTAADLLVRMMDATAGEQCDYCGEEGVPVAQVAGGDLICPGCFTDRVCDKCEGSGEMMVLAYPARLHGHPDDRHPEEWTEAPCTKCDQEGIVEAYLALEGLTMAEAALWDEFRDLAKKGGRITA